MDNERLYFHSQLETLFPGLNLYYRPSSKLIIEYPCIVYDVKQYRVNRSQNLPYINSTTFRAKVMSKIPGISNVNGILQLPNSRHIRSYMSDDIVHEIFDISTKTL